MNLTAFQKEASRRDAGFTLLLWRRQAGKTTHVARKALRIMLATPGRLVTFASASLNVGREVTEREAHLWFKLLNDFKATATSAGVRAETNADKADADGWAELFEAGKLEVSVWHSRTLRSRTKVIAPNPATARGYSGDVIIDEIGFINNFKDLWEAMEPIASRDPTFRVLMATTPPADDSHYSYELSIPPENTTFQVNPAGNWYVSQAGVLVHRVDVWDAYAAGGKLFDTHTRKPIPPEEHRAKALDRDAWDRNYALVFKSGGTAAITLLGLHTAMQKGRDAGLASEDDIPQGWKSLLTPEPFAVGFDIATTENATSNPSGLVLAQRDGSGFVVRLALRFKSGSREKTKAIIRDVLDLPGAIRPRRLVIDATNERFFAQELRSEFSGICPVELVVSSEKIAYHGNEMSFKAYLGNQLVNLFDDGTIAIPDSRWVKDDLRLVTRDRGSFSNRIDSAGNHGDVFDAMKLSIHGLVGTGGPADAHPARVGTYTSDRLAANPSATFWRGEDDDSPPERRVI